MCIRDRVYIATPNFAHYDNTIACLQHGKAVLCEKPFALNYTQAKEMIELATEKHILLAEAMWMRYQPLAAKIIELINDGVIGKPRLLLANKGEADLAPEGLNPATGGRDVYKRQRRTWAHTCGRWRWTATFCGSICRS